MRRALAVVVLLIAIVVAGCGGGDGGSKASPKQTYAKQLAVAAKPLQDAFADADQVGANVKTSQIVAHLGSEAKVVEDAVVKIQKITPPPALAATHRKLIEGLKELAASFRQGAAAAGRNDTKTLATALRKLTTSDGVKKLTEASAELKAQGVTVTNPSSN